MIEKKNVADDSFKDLNAGRDIKINIGDSKSGLQWKIILLGVIVIAAIVMLIILRQPPKELNSNTNETHGSQSPIVADSGGNVNINYQNTDPFAEDSMKNKKTPK
ncbi:MAG TPA: hypothetical protein VE978_15090 [Chitinophagales bacterium]|nr:hypothetical protein [Chitinophagales bacterium]